MFSHVQVTGTIKKCIFEFKSMLISKLIRARLLGDVVYNDNLTV